MKKYMKLYNTISNNNDVRNIKKNVDDLRTNLYSYDDALLQFTNLKLNFGEFQNIPNGRFIITHNNIDFNCLFKREDKSENLYVIFSGARPINQTEPVFKRWSYYKFIDGNTLNIDDPMYNMHKGLHCGWYYGNAEESYCDYIVEIIVEFAKQNNIKNIILFSSSAGGFAALYCACRIPNSIAVAINPQIKRTW